MQYALAGVSLFQGVTNSILQSNAIKMRGQYQQQVYQQNIRLANVKADDAIKRGELEIQNYMKGVRKLIGTQRTVFAAQGVQIGSGSALDIEADTAQQAKITSITMRNNAWLQAWGYKQEALNLESSASFGKIASDFSANTTLLTGISSSITNAFKIGTDSKTYSPQNDVGANRSPSAL